MNQHINQCKYNEEFLSELNSKFPDTFSDWKVTVVFYCAIHLIRGYALSKGKTLGDRHTHVFEYLEEETSKTSKIYKAFKVIYRNSRDSRYNGFTTRENFERLCNIKLNESRTMLGRIKSYVESKGIKIEMVQQ